VLPSSGGQCDGDATDLIHGDGISDNRGRLGYAYEETQSWKSEKAPRGLDI